MAKLGEKTKELLALALMAEKMSSGERLKVGAAISDSDGNVIATACNDISPAYFPEPLEDIKGKTKETVSHAEESCICQAAKAGISTDGGVILTTQAPCAVCARMIVLSGIKWVLFVRDTPNRGGHEILRDNNIKQVQIDITNGVGKATYKTYNPDALR